MLSRRAVTVTWVLQFVVAAILAQTLFFKFTGAEESVHIFRTVGAEPAGRIGSGIVELVAAVLLLIPRTVVYGAMLALVVIVGAIGSHLTVLGIEVMGDGGLLFALALTVLGCSSGVLVIRRKQIPLIGCAVEAGRPFTRKE